MAETLYLILKAARPRQWVKNAAVFASLVFSGFFFYQFPFYLFRVVAVAAVFCFASSAIYILNDIIDRESDRQHPYKRKRPIASGQLSVETASIAAALFALGAVVFGWMLSPFVLLLVILYVALHIGYSFKLKHVAILDVLTIAAGFMIRVYAGAVVVNLHMSVWFLLTVISASLFMAVAKRQSERTLLTVDDPNVKSFTTRKTLDKYSQRLLDIYTGMFANATWLTYALFAFQQENIVTSGPLPTFMAFIPRAFTAQKWLMVTVPFVIYGVMRYLQLVYEQNKGESPERVILQDKELLTAGILWGASVMFILYVLG
jgi:4-hydroxybenzoate polyprenyltransferase